MVMVLESDVYGVIDSRLWCSGVLVMVSKSKGYAVTEFQLWCHRVKGAKQI
jgi:hypothetical protein